jgi:hypothetical protein
MTFCIASNTLGMGIVIQAGGTAKYEMYVKIFHRLRDAMRRNHQGNWENGHKTANFFCRKMHLYISHWWSQCSMP